MKDKVLNKLKDIKLKFLSLGWFEKIGLGVLVLVLGFLVFGRKKDNNEIVYQTEKAKTGSVTQIVAETGEIMSTGRTEVTSTITGIVEEVYVDNEGQVYRGQNLFKVVSSVTEAERTKAYSSYLTAKNTLETAQRNKDTYESDMWVSHEDYETRAIDPDKPEDDPIYIETNRDWLAAEQKYLDQQQVIDQAKVAISNAWLNYQATIDGIVVAPIGGRIVNLAVAVGQEVTSTDTALMIVSDQKTWVVLAVSESDVIKLKPEQAAEVRVDALGDEVFKAEVKRVDEIGTERSGIVTYNIYLVLGEPSVMIRPAMTIQAEIITEEKDGVLVVPEKAVKPYQGSRAVQMMSKKTGQMIYKPVEIGIEGESYVEIVSGLKEGDEVIVSQVSQVSDEEKQSKRNGGIFPVPGGGGR
ncbi:MAG: efflux RND transporter periplasmic adaptor subunit [Patescibacteria group bacterium]|nr:efflux RND transporter periplasmic adaptor subunit [Patescibacteria group bacterium]